MLNRTALGLVAVAGIASPTLAQDSVAPGLGGTDAVSAYSSSTQRLLYTVDVAPFQSSKGRTFGLALIAKTSGLTPDDTSTFDNGLISGNAISKLADTGSLYTGPFASWNTAGQGVTPNVSDTPGSAMLPAGEITRLGYGFSDFSGATIGSPANIVVGQIAYSADNPSRLYVSREYAAQNSSTGSANTFNAGFGFNSIDTALNATFRADAFSGSLMGPNEISGQNIFRVSAGARNVMSTNEISQSGAQDSGSTTEIVRGGGTTLSVPSSVPALAGGPSYFGPNFNSQIVYETGTGTSGSSLHLNGTTDHRGTVSLIAESFYNGNDSITAAMLTKDADDQTTAVSIWGAANSGQPGLGNFYPSPLSVTDPVTTTVLNRGESTHNGSQTPFSAGPQVGLGTDANGDLIFAFTTEALTTPTSPAPGANGTSAANVIVAGRVKANNPSVAEWSTAGYVDPNFGSSPTGTLGKPITDASGNVVGEMYPYQLLGLAGTGPSISSPSVDSAGNVYFTGVGRFYGQNGVRDDAPIAGPFEDDFLEVTVFRANYIADTGDGSFGFDLESLVRVGDIFTSPGTGLQYRINNIELIDSNSIASSAAYANATTSAPFAADTDGNDGGASDPDTLGGMVVAMNIAYDVDGDGAFGSADGMAGGFDEDDQQYTVLSLIVPAIDGPTFPDCNNNGMDDTVEIANDPTLDVNTNGVIDSCEDLTRLCADVNNDGVVNGLDFGAWLGAFNAGLFTADVNQDGLVNGLDFGAWLGTFNQGPNGPLCLPVN